MSNDEPVETRDQTSSCSGLPACAFHGSFVFYLTVYWVVGSRERLRWIVKGRWIGRCGHSSYQWVFVIAVIVFEYVIILLYTCGFMFSPSVLLLDFSHNSWATSDLNVLHTQPCTYFRSCLGISKSLNESFGMIWSVSALFSQHQNGVTCNNTKQLVSPVVLIAKAWWLLWATWHLLDLNSCLSTHWELPCGVCGFWSESEHLLWCLFLRFWFRLLWPSQLFLGRQLLASMTAVLKDWPDLLNLTYVPAALEFLPESN